MQNYYIIMQSTEKYDHNALRVMIIIFDLTITNQMASYAFLYVILVEI